MSVSIVKSIAINELTARGKLLPATGSRGSQHWQQSKSQRTQSQPALAQSRLSQSQQSQRQET
jgi:hypothetical protein